MIEKEKTSQSGDSPKSHENNLNEEDQRPTGLVSRESLIRRLSRGAEARTRFLESHLNKSLAFQIRSLRENERWTQGQFAEKLGVKHPNNVSARLENPNYGKHTLTTLKNIAATCDVGLVVWFIPYSRFADWASATPYLDSGLTPEFYNIPAFNQDPRIVCSAEKGQLGTVADKNNLMPNPSFDGLLNPPPKKGAASAAA